MNPLVVVLATKRLTQLIVEDELTKPLQLAINKWAADAPEFSFRDRIATLSGCQACMSVWAGAGILLASRLRVGQPLVRVLAASAAALFLHAVVERLER